MGVTGESGAVCDTAEGHVPGMRAPVEQATANAAVTVPVVDQLPPGGADFVGRADELDTLYTWVTGPGAAIPAQLEPVDPERPGTARTVWLPRDRVVAITGPVGVGRSEFAVRLAHRLAPHFPDGRLYARLTGPRGEVIPPGDVLEALLYALGTVLIPSSHEERIRLFRQHLDGKRFLLLLEDVTGTAQLRPLLPQSPTALVLVTAVAPLTGIGRAAAVRSCLLGVLDPRASVELLGNLAGHTRVACDPRAADDLAALCDYQPAALRMAGAWLRARPRYAMSDVGRRLRAERLRLHDQAGEDVAVRACFSLIHRELVPSAARLLRLLALVPGREFGADAAAALVDCGPDAATRSLTELRELHLLEAGSVPGRFRFHEMVRGYVQERLDAEERPGERRNARVRLLDRYVRLARSAERIILGARGPEPEADVRFASADEARAWLRDERPELLAAARVAAAAGLDATTRRLVAVLTRLLDRRAHWSDVRELHELALTTARRVGSGRQEAVALLNLGNLHVARHELEEALSCYRAALEVSRALGDPAGEGRAMVNLGNAYADLGDLQRAADWYDRSLLLRRTIGDAAGQARVLSHLGRLHARMGRFEQSVRDHRAALGVRRRIGDPAGIGRVLTDIAGVLGEAGRSREALAVYRDALEAFRAAGDERLEGLALLRSAEPAQDAGDVRDARLRRRQALALLVESGAPEADEVRRLLGDE